MKTWNRDEKQKPIHQPVVKRTTTSDPDSDGSRAKIVENARPAIRRLGCDGAASEPDDANDPRIMGAS